MNKIRIVSDGTAASTKVFAVNRDNGMDIQLDSISSIEILPIEPNCVNRVRLTFVNVEYDILADLED